MLYLCYYIYLFVWFIPVLHVPPPRVRICSCMVVWAVVFCCILERRTVGRSNGMISLLEEVERLKVPAVCPSVTASLSVSVSVSVSRFLSADYQSLLRCATRPRLGVSSRRALAHTRSRAHADMHEHAHKHTFTLSRTKIAHMNPTRTRARARAHTEMWEAGVYMLAADIHSSLIEVWNTFLGFVGTNKSTLPSALIKG